MTTADYSYCGDYNSACSTDSCCIYVSASYCGPRISVNSMVCVPKYPAIAAGDLIPLTDMSGWATG